MMERIAATRHDSFIGAAQKEMIRFERQEIDFRKKDRLERAAELHIPIAEIETH
jgi:hypothetical protein